MEDKKSSTLKTDLVEIDGKQYIRQKYQKEKLGEKVALATMDILILAVGIFVAIVAAGMIVAYLMRLI